MSSASWSTRERVASLAPGTPRMTIDTNAVEIPAAWATSAIVGRIPWARGRPASAPP